MKATNLFPTESKRRIARWGLLFSLTLLVLLLTCLSGARAETEYSCKLGQTIKISHGATKYPYIRVAYW